MRLKSFISVLAVSAMTVTGALQSGPVIASVQAAEGSATVSSCARPPADPDATEETRDRFIDLWAPRFADNEWLTAYTKLDTMPSQLLDEGFHAMSEEVQVWLDACLLDDMLATTGEVPTPKKRAEYLIGVHMLVFGKEDITKIRQGITDSPTASAPPAQQVPVKQDQTAQALEDMSDRLTSTESLTSSDQPKADVSAPSPISSGNVTGPLSSTLKKLVGAAEVPTTASAPTAAAAPNAVPTGLEPNPITQIPLVPLVLQAVNSLLTLISQIQGVLFTLPVVNLLASGFYKICAESATMPLACSISLPVGVPIPADVTGDGVPDVLGALFPVTNLIDVGAKFQVTRMHSAPLPAHVFAVYDTPIVKKRIEVGFDGRASTLAYNQGAQFSVKNVAKALTGDVQVAAVVTAAQPGATEALTFAVKDLVGGSVGVPASEENPVAGSVQLNPFPEKFTVNARFTHTPAKDQDTFKIESTTPSRVDAIVDQRTTTTTPQSNRRFTATVDKLPTSVVVDLIRDGEKQSIDYTASAPINLVRASDTATPDVSKPDSFTESIYEVKGVPTKVHVDLQGAQDIAYTANAKVPEVSFSTRTLDQGVRQQQITAKAHQVPKSVHVTNLTNDVEQRVTYTADDELADVELGMYDLDEQGSETDLQAKAIGIPKALEFVSTQATGAYDLSAPDGIDLIEATLTRNSGLVLPMPGQDHATVYKRGEQLGLDFRLSGFAGAHFDGHEETNVALQLNPGGQSFDAIADIDDPDGGPNVLATASIAALPSSMEVAFDPDNGTADYTASSVIPTLEASFTDRDSGMFGNAKLTDIPKNIGLTFNTEGETPEVTYDADSRLGAIELNYSEKPDGLGIHGLIEDLPQYMRVGGLDPIVFDARTSAGAAPASSDIGKILFKFATDGIFASPSTTDDHAYVDTDLEERTHAQLQYSGLRYLSVDTSDQELHATIKNTAPRLFRAFLTTPTLTLTGFIDKVPAEITVAQVGDLVTYDASSPIDQISTDLNRTNGDHLAVEILDVPASIAVLFDGAGSKLEWDASGATGQVSALAHLTPDTLGGTRTFDAGLTITDIPATWDAGWADGNVLFDAPGGIGTIAARVTNHGSFHLLTGDHLSAFYDEASGDLDASLQISNLRKAGFTKLTGGNGGGFVADLNMGTGGTFKFAADVTLATSTLKAAGEFNHLPSTINLRSDGGRIQYSGNTNPDLTVSVEAGAPAALALTPSPAFVHGVAVRDGASGPDKAVKAKLYLTGLPTGLDLNSPAGTYEVIGYNPTIATLVVDAKLTALAPEPLTLQVQQVVPTASPVNFKFGPFLTDTAGDGTQTLSLNYTANQTLGSLTAEATYADTDNAKLEISAIPSSISVNAGFGAEQKTVGVAMSHGISDIKAYYKKVGEIDFAAAVHLHDVPSAVNLVIGRASASDGTKDVTAPDFTFTASQPGLDLDVTATAAIATPVDVKAAVDLSIENMGSTVTGQLEGTTLKITSAPATDKFLLNAAGGVKLDVDLGFSWGPLTNTGNLGVDIDINKLTLGFENASSLQLDLGITTGLKGDYSTFTFGIDSDTEIDLQNTLRIVIGTPFGDVDFNIFSIDPAVHIDLNNVISHFRLASNRLATVFSIIIIDVLLGYCSYDIKLRPRSEGSTSGSSFTLNQPPSDGSNPPAWLITPNPNFLGVSVPDFVVDIIMYFTSPYGKDIGGELACHDRLPDL